jgi:hypothetical protein
MRIQPIKYEIISFLRIILGLKKEYRKRYFTNECVYHSKY